MVLPRELTPAMRDLASRVMKLSREHPGDPEALELSLDLSQSHAHAGIDLELKHARRMVPVLRAWPATEGGADPALAAAADAIQRACKLTEADLDPDGPPPVTAAVLVTELKQVLGDEFTPEQLDRAAVVAWSVLELLRCQQPAEAETEAH
jgi:hypothetical protein